MSVVASILKQCTVLVRCDIYALLCVYYVRKQMKTSSANEMLQITRVECELIFDISYMSNRVSSILFIQFITQFINFNDKSIYNFFPCLILYSAFYSQSNVTRAILIEWSLFSTFSTFIPHH